MPFGSGKGGRREKRRWGFCGGKGLKWPWQSRRPLQCICPKCDLAVPYQPGLPCYQTKCPRCGSPMTRSFFHE